jgi:hypothetical protein
LVTVAFRLNKRHSERIGKLISSMMVDIFISSHACIIIDAYGDTTAGCARIRQIGRENLFWV